MDTYSVSWAITAGEGSLTTNDARGRDARILAESDPVRIVGAGPGLRHRPDNDKQNATTAESKKE